MDDDDDHYPSDMDRLSERIDSVERGLGRIHEELKVFAIGAGLLLLVILWRVW